MGITCLVIGIGIGGAGWIDRLVRSAWYAGLAPRSEDLAVAGGVATGCRTVPAGTAGLTGYEDAQIAAFVAQARLPTAPLATIAVCRDAELQDKVATRALVSALRRRRNASGCRPMVVVTIEAGLTSHPTFVQELLRRGAFVLQAGHGAPVDHLHHFPLRAAIEPRSGRLVCADLADHLTTWMPGATADLHVIPSDFNEAVLALSRLEMAPGSFRRAGALNLHVHLDRAGAGGALANIDRLATHVQARVPGSNGNLVFTTTERMDGVTGSADLVVIHPADASSDCFRPADRR